MRTIDLSTVTSEFDSMVHSELENKEYLAGTVREYDTEGEIFQIPYFGSVDLQEGDFSAGNIPITDLTKRPVQIKQKNFVLKTVIGKAYETLFNYDVVAGYARQHAASIGRFLDNLKLQAVIGNDSNYTTGNNNLVELGTGDAQVFNVDKLVTARYMLTENGVTDEIGGISAWLPARNMPNFFKDVKFTSWDYNQNRPYQDNNNKQYMGVDFRIMGQVGTNNLPVVSGNNNIYIVSRDSAAIGFNRRPMSKVIFDEGEDRICVLTVATAGSVVTLNTGAVKIIAKV